MPRVGWPIPPRPQPWLVQRPAVSVPQPGAQGLVQQPLFPVQNFRPPMPSTVPPGLQPSLTVAPPVLPASAPATVSQPLFPVVSNNNITTQAPPFSAPLFSTTVPLSSSAENNSSNDMHGSNISSLANSYHTPGFPGFSFLHTVVAHKISYQMGDFKVCILHLLVKVPSENGCLEGMYWISNVFLMRNFNHD